jgi:hypothetical protein
VEYNNKECLNILGSVVSSVTNPLDYKTNSQLPCIMTSIKRKQIPWIHCLADWAFLCSSHISIIILKGYINYNDAVPLLRKSHPSTLCILSSCRRQNKIVHLWITRVLWSPFYYFFEKRCLPHGFFMAKLKSNNTMINIRLSQRQKDCTIADVSRTDNQSLKLAWTRMFHIRRTGCHWAIWEKYMGIAHAATALK